ncbi:hypothetical protein HDU89_006280 [Geranomyces variabilis]|nr:hypothetical protein HDU89_006280 [Geranomyces variabilis]
MSPHGGQIDCLELSGKTFAGKLPCEWGAPAIVGSEEEDRLYGLQQEAFAGAEHGAGQCGARQLAGHESGQGSGPERSVPDHRREVEENQGSTLTVKGLMVTERSELTTAETTIRTWLHGAGEKVEPEARKQLKDGSTKDVHKWSEIFELPRTQHPPVAVNPYTPASRVSASWTREGLFTLAIARLTFNCRLYF